MRVRYVPQKKIDHFFYRKDTTRAQRGSTPSCHITTYKKVEPAKNILDQATCIMLIN